MLLREPVTLRLALPEVLPNLRRPPLENVGHDGQFLG